MWNRKKPMRNSGLSESSAPIPAVTLGVKDQHLEMQERCSRGGGEGCDTGEKKEPPFKQ